MPFAASSKSVVASVRAPVARMGRFFQTAKSLDRLRRTTPEQKGARTSLTGFTRSVGTLKNDLKD